jgi:exopolysaccharide biosynthesis polyprenyl glycosylphosphotransferase
VEEIFQAIDERAGLRVAVRDQLILVVAAILAWTIALAASSSSIEPGAVLLFAGILCVDVIVLFLIGAYLSETHRALHITIRLLITIAGAVVLSGHYWSDDRFWIFAGLTGVIAVSSGCLIYSSALVRPFERMHVSTSAWTARPVVALAGEGAAVNQCRARFDKALGSRFAFIQMPSLTSQTGQNADGMVRGACLDRVLKFVAANNVAYTVVARDADPLLYDIVAELKLRGCNVACAETFLQRQLRAIEPSDGYNSYWTLRSPYRPSIVSRTGKRVCDLVVATVLLLLIVPLLAVSAAAIRLTSRGPVLYRQMRVGLKGRTFTLYKLRSMRVDAETREKPQWASRRDPRVTTIGRWLRQYHIDELPQLFNILKGDMSFVGPRPERPEFVDLLTQRLPCYRIRHTVKPGLTGWAQINYPYGASIEDARRKLAFDLYYVERAGVLFDLFITMRTFRVVALCEGAR